MGIVPSLDETKQLCNVRFNFRDNAKKMSVRQHTLNFFFKFILIFLLITNHQDSRPLKISGKHISFAFSL